MSQNSTDNGTFLTHCPDCREPMERRLHADICRPCNIEVARHAR